MIISHEFSTIPQFYEHVLVCQSQLPARRRIVMPPTTGILFVSWIGTIINQVIRTSTNPLYYRSGWQLATVQLYGSTVAPHLSITKAASHTRIIATYLGKWDDTIWLQVRTNDRVEQVANSFVPILTEIQSSGYDLHELIVVAPTAHGIFDGISFPL